MDERSGRVRFVIVGLQRSGTSVTQSALSGHPNVGMMPSEILAPFYEEGIGAFTGRKESYQTRKWTYPALFDTIASVFSKEQTRAIGFKAAVGSHDMATDLTDCLREYLPGVRIILIQRDDLVAQLGSYLRATQTGVWHAWEGATSSESRRIRIAAADFRNYAIDCRRAVAQIRSIAATHDLLELSYENDIVPATGYARAFGFLGLPEIPVTWLRMAKLNPAPETFIERYAELRLALDALPEVTDVEVAEIARRRLLERSRAESFGFLMHRALDRLWRDLVDDAHADVQIALANSQEFPLPSTAGRVCAMLERKMAGSKEPAGVRQTLTEMERIGGANAYFRLNRGQMRLDGALLEPAHADFVAALQGQPDLDSDSAQAAFDGLERIWLQQQDVSLAEATLAALAERYEGSAAYLLLKGAFLCHVGSRDAGVELIKRAAAVDPDHPRPCEMLKVWNAG